MICCVCGMDLCLHPIVLVHGFSYTPMHECLCCGAVGFGKMPHGYCLPMYDGEVDFNSDVYGPVCRECHDSYQGSVSGLCLP